MVLLQFTIFYLSWDYKHRPDPAFCGVSRKFSLVKVVSEAVAGHSTCMCVPHVCTACVFWMCVPHVCTACVFRMYVLHVCSACVYWRPRGHHYPSPALLKGPCQLLGLEMAMQKGEGSQTWSHKGPLTISQ